MINDTDEFDKNEEELAALIREYDQNHGIGAGDEIAVGLMFSHGISGIIRVFKNANGRKIVLEHPESIVDGVIVRYVGQSR